MLQVLKLYKPADTISPTVRVQVLSVFLGEEASLLQRLTVSDFAQGTWGCPVTRQGSFQQEEKQGIIPKQIHYHTHRRFHL